MLVACPFCGVKLPSITTHHPLDYHTLPPYHSVTALNQCPLLISPASFPGVPHPDSTPQRHTLRAHYIPQTVVIPDPEHYHPALTSQPLHPLQHSSVLLPVHLVVWDLCPGGPFPKIGGGEEPLPAPITEFKLAWYDKWMVQILLLLYNLGVPLWQKD